MVIFITGPAVYRRSFFLSSTNGRSAFTASARLLQKHSSDRIVICVNYISRFACFSRYCLPTLHYELSSILGKFRLHGRVLDLVYENLATSRYKAKPTNAYRAVGSTNRFPSLIRPLANYTVLDQCKSCISWFLFFFSFCDAIKKKKKTGQRNVSFLNYYVTCKRSRGVGSAHGSGWKWSNQCAAWATMVPIAYSQYRSIDRLSRLLKLLNSRKITRKSRSARPEIRRKRTTTICPFHDYSSRPGWSHLPLVSFRHFPFSCINITKVRAALVNGWDISGREEEKDFLPANMVRVRMHD